jgi:two-component system sensor histidine kinase EvgS
MRKHSTQNAQTLPASGLMSLPTLDDGNLPWLAAMVAALLYACWRQIRLQRELRRARQLSWNLQAVIIHEIRTPLCAIVKLLELSRQHQQTPGHAQELQLAAQNSSRLLLELLDDMLTQSKLEMGKLVLNPQAVNIERLVQELAKSYHPIASQQKLRFEVQTDCALPCLQIDILRLRQILSNLLSNAIKFTQHGQISLSVKTRPGNTQGMAKLEIQVNDTGIGMSAEAQRELFTLFGSSGEAARQRYGGHGLGLCLCQHLTRLMEGKIQVSSQLGLGTRLQLQFEFPVASPASAPRLPGLNLEGLHALIADDDQANQMLLKRQLEQRGLKVSCSGDGEQALRIWSQGKTDILFCDMHMPGLDGTQLVKRIRRLERRLGRTPMPVIGISADPSRPMANSGVDVCVSKPLSGEDLQHSLRLCSRDPPPRPRPSRVRYEVLQQLSQGDSAFEEDFIRTVLLNNQQDLDKLLDADARHDMAQMAQALHRIKSVLRLLSDEALCQQCQTLELAIREQAQARIAVQLPDMAREIIAIHQELEQRLKRGH